MNKILAVFLLIFLLGCNTNKQNTNDPFEQLTRFVDQYSENIIEQGNVKTMSVAVYKNGKTYHNYYKQIDSDVGQF